MTYSAKYLVLTFKVYPMQRQRANSKMARHLWIKRYPKLCQTVTGPWWSSGLERQSHRILVMLKVEGSNPRGAYLFAF